MSQPFSSSAAQRNKGPIFQQLTPLLTGAARVLEIGAGDGVHACHAATCLPAVRWQASERPQHLPRLQAALAAQTELAPPIALDVLGSWPQGPFTVVYAANVAHIMAWPEVVQLFAGSASVLDAAGLLCLYGPFFDDTVVTAPGNRAFDARLQAMDAAMGLRRVQALDALAQDHRLLRRHDWTMPANNRLLVWQKQS